MDMKFTVFGYIQKPVGEVFDAVYRPEQLSQYFTTAEASGPMDTGVTITWEFADFPGPFPVSVLENIPNKKLVFEWTAAGGDHDNCVEICFIPLSSNATKVTIRESGWRETQEGLNASYINCMGWSQMLACLKAWLEYGINLRNGFYTEEKG